MTRDLEPVQTAMWKALTKLGVAQPLRERQVLIRWEQIVGTQIANAARPLRWDNQMLWIAVKSHTWAQELQLQAEEILSRLNEEAGKKIFTSLRFVTRTRLPDKPTWGQPESEDSTEAYDYQVEVAEEDKQAVAARLSRVEDDRLRAALQRAMETQWGADRWRKQHGWQACERCGALHNEPETLCFLCRADY